MKNNYVDNINFGKWYPDVGLFVLFYFILFLVSISQMELQIGGEINNLDKMLTLRSSSSSECILYPQPQSQFY